MAEDSLVSSMSGSRHTPLIVEGAALLKSLDDAGIPIHAAYWIFDPEARDWKYILSSPLVTSEGPLKMYRRLQTYLANSDLKLQDIAVVTMHDPLLVLLRSAIHTSATDIAGIRFTANTIKNIFIDDAYIYRVA